MEEYLHFVGKDWKNWKFLGPTQAVAASLNNYPLLKYYIQYCNLQVYMRLHIKVKIFPSCHTFRLQMRVGGQTFRTCQNMPSSGKGSSCAIPKDIALNWNRFIPVWQQEHKSTRSVLL